MTGLGPPAASPPSDAPEPSRRLTGPAVLADPLVQELLEARLVGVLSTLEANSAMHAIPLWYAFDGEAIVFATGSRSRKVRNLRRDPRGTFVLHDSRPGFEVCGASIRGRVELIEGKEATALIELVHRRYVAPIADQLPTAGAFLASDDVAGRLLPESAMTWDERASAASSELRLADAALPLVPTSPRAL